MLRSSPACLSTSLFPNMGVFHFWFSLSWMGSDASILACEIRLVAWMLKHICPLLVRNSFYVEGWHGQIYLCWEVSRKTVVACLQPVHKCIVGWQAVNANMKPDEMWSFVRKIPPLCLGTKFTYCSIKNAWYYFSLSTRVCLMVRYAPFVEAYVHFSWLEMPLCCV